MIREITPEFPSSDKVVVLEFVQDGGLGNQMAEWAAGYSIARTLNLPFRWKWKPSKLRTFGLTAFGIEENPPEEYELVMSKAGQGSRRLYERAIRMIKGSPEKVCAVSCPFQDEACFIDYADEIREFFKLEPFELTHPEGTTPVGVQVRRGDYAGHSRLDVTTPKYFLDSMAWMRSHVKKPHFFVVSDDPEYCKTIFRKPDDITIMPPQSAIDGLRTLASCEAHIISNSTFGWWGAWLGEDGPVIVPEHWHHQPGTYGDWTPAPARWIKFPIGQPLKPALSGIVPRRVIVLPDPEIPRAIVYPWHADKAKWEELRFSLRSVEKHFEDKECPIFIYGTRRPSFIPEKHHRIHYRGAYTYSEALGQGVQAADKVLWMNDDVVMLKPTTWADCSVPYYMSQVAEDFLEIAASGNNPWREGCIRVMRELTEKGVGNQRVYSTHLPYVWERGKALDVLEEFGLWDKAPFELMYFHLYPDGAKMLTTERTHDLPNDEAMFLNYTDRHLTDAFKDQVMKLFPEPASWETLGGRF
jgi:hypothetical protein